MKKVTGFVSLVLMILILAGCGSTAQIPASNTLERLGAQYQTKKLKEYDSPYTALYPNKDGNYDLYIFSSPVQFWTQDGYAPMDNRLTAAKKEGYLVQNKAGEVQSFFPKTLAQPFLLEKGEQSISLRLEQNNNFKEGQQCTFENMYGSRVEAVKYEGEKADMYYYPTNLGIRMEVQTKTEDAPAAYDFQVIINSEMAAASEEEGYIKLYDGAELTGLFYSALSTGQGEAPYQKNHATVTQTDEQQGNTFSIRYETGSAGRGDASLEFYANKMPDSTAYENGGQYPYLSDSYQLSDSEKGAANHYLRFRINYFLTTMSTNILSAQYHVSILNSISTRKEETSAIQLHRVQGQWSSTGLTWVTKGTPGDEIGLLTAEEEGCPYFDVTDFVKECVDDPAWMTESTGAFISGHAKDMWLATSDNTLYTPYLKITFKERPSYFDPKININDVNF